MIVTIKNPEEVIVLYLIIKVVFARAYGQRAVFKYA